MGSMILAMTKYCVPLRLFSQSDVWRSLSGSTGHINSVSRAGPKAKVFMIGEAKMLIVKGYKYVSGIRTQFCKLDEAVKSLIRAAMGQMNLSARGITVY